MGCKHHENMTTHDYCNKPRLVYSKTKLSGNYTNRFKRAISELQFVCGVPLF